MWADLDNHDSESVATLTERSGAVVGASKTIAVRQSLGYYSTLAGTKPVLIHPDEIDADATLRDPFISYWLALKNGHPEAEALALGSSRILDVMTNLVTATSREAGGLFVAKSDLHVESWERITDEEACSFCEDIASQTFDSASSASFQPHDRCGCSTAPVF